MPRLTGGEIIAKYLEKEGVEYDGPAIVEAVVEPDNADSGAIVTGKWDLADLER